MTGPEHYREAELLLDIDPDDREHSRALTARAQAHATLALTATWEAMVALQSRYLNAAVKATTDASAAVASEWTKGGAP